MLHKTKLSSKSYMYESAGLKGFTSTTTCATYVYKGQDVLHFVYFFFLFTR